ncbi:MAG: hypothetical protein FWG87_02005 [Defluviitaleaceae bacterium]|nr:hypothetical protein [Defluviitaleaceae bacterium]
MRAYLGTDKSVPYKELTRFYRSCDCAFAVHAVVVCRSCVCCSHVCRLCICRSCVCRGVFVGDEFTRPEVCT